MDRKVGARRDGTVTPWAYPLVMEWTGTFEIPRSGVRVGGRLTIDDVDSLLTTFGALAEVSGEPVTDIFTNEDDKTLPMVWCTTEEGKQLTLLDLISLGGNVSIVGGDLSPTRQQWIVGSAVGGLIEPVEPVTFSSMSFGLTDLSAWLQATRPTEELRWDTPRVDLSLSTPDIAEVIVDDLTINFSGRIGVRHGFDSITIDYPTRVVATPANEMTWHDMVNTVVTPMEVLLWTATGRFSALDEPKVRLNGDHPQYQQIWLSLLQPRRFTQPKNRTTSHDMLYSAADIPGGLESGITRWYRIWEGISPAFGPVIARYRAPFTYTNDRFHTAVAALESYSVQRKPPRNAGRPGLRTRLNHLLNEAGDLGHALVGNDREHFLSAVIKARNAYAHSARIVGAIEGGPALHWAAEGLNWILRYHALTEIGFDPEPARQRVLTNQRFIHDAGRLREALEQPEAN